MLLKGSIVILEHFRSGDGDFKAELIFSAIESDLSGNWGEIATEGQISREKRVC